MVVGFLSWNLAGAFSTLAYFVISIGYGIACEWGWRGQTIGKRFFRLRVVDVEGMRLQFNQIVTRNLLRFVDALPAAYFVGGLACWFSPKCQRLGDLAANTVVICNPHVTEPDIDQLLAGKFNSLPVSTPRRAPPAECFARRSRRGVAVVGASRRIRSHRSHRVVRRTGRALSRQG